MRKKAVLAFFTAVIFGMTVAAQANPTAPLSTPELKQIIGAGKKTVVFFINPNGGPCRAQKEILEKLHKDRKANFSIAYVSTMREEDQKAFYDYGIRSLPSLVVVDTKGKIGRIFPPGIQSYETLSSTIDGI